MCGLGLREGGGRGLLSCMAIARLQTMKTGVACPGAPTTSAAAQSPAWRAAGLRMHVLCVCRRPASGGVSLTPVATPPPSHAARAAAPMGSTAPMTPCLMRASPGSTRRPASKCPGTLCWAIMIMAVGEPARPSVAASKGRLCSCTACNRGLCRQLSSMQQRARSCFLKGSRGALWCGRAGGRAGGCAGAAALPAQLPFRAARPAAPELTRPSLPPLLPRPARPADGHYGPNDTKAYYENGREITSCLQSLYPCLVSPMHQVGAQHAQHASEAAGLGGLPHSQQQPIPEQQRTLACCCVYARACRWPRAVGQGRRVLP